MGAAGRLAKRKTIPWPWSAVAANQMRFRRPRRRSARRRPPPSHPKSTPASITHLFPAATLRMQKYPMNRFSGRSIALLLLADQPLHLGERSDHLLEGEGDNCALGQEELKAGETHLIPTASWQLATAVCLTMSGVVV